MTSKKLFVLAIVLSLITAGSVYFYLQKLENDLDKNEYVNVYEVIQRINADSKIKSNLFKEKKIPVQYVNSNVVTDINEVIGKISKVTLFAGEIVLKDHLVNIEKNHNRLAYKVPKGKRAVSIAVNEVSGVSRLLMPGDIVDVIATLDLEDKFNNNEVITQTNILLQNIDVLAVGNLIKKDNLINKNEYKTVTLAVNLEEAPKLVLASERGTIRLLLRLPIDGEKVKIPPVHLEDMIERW